MIKYNNSNINDWYYGTSDIIKVYRNGAVVYYKVITSGDTPEYQVCYAVVDDISQYSDTEFVDVFNKADEKWYKLNNLNQYEEYGVYGTSTAETQSRLPQGYTEVEYVENTSSAYLNLDVYPYNSSSNSYAVEAKFSSTQGSNQFEYLFSCEQGNLSPYVGFVARWQTTTPRGLLLDGTNYTSKNITNNQDGTSGFTITSNLTNATNTTPITLFCGLQGSTVWRNGKGKVYSFKVTINDNLVRDMIPCKRDNDNMAGMYDIVNDVFYYPPNYSSYQLVAGSEVTPTAATYYEGKLAIVDGYEYMYSGSSWVNVGEVSGSSRLPQGYTEVEYITAENLASGITGPYIDTNFTPNQNTRVVLDYQAIVNGQNNRRIFGSGRFNNTSSGNYIWSMENRIGQSNCYYYYKFDNGSSWKTTSLHPDLNRHTVDFNKEGKIWLDDTAVVTLPSNTVNCSYHLGLFNEINSGAETVYEYFQGRVYSCQVYDNGTLVRDLVPCTNSNNVAGMYDVVGNTFYSSARQSYQFDAGSATSHVVYPIYYDEKADPLNNLTFETMEDAQDYAYNNCVYDGMRATIDGTKYYFDTDEGWVEIPYYYKFEDVTPNAASGWTISGSSTYNPQPSYYDDFSVENSTTTNVTKIAKVTIYGYDHFTYYLRSYGYNTYAYLTSTNIDELQSNPTSMINYSNSNAITNTYYWNKTAGSTVNLSNYRRVTYNNLDKTVEHTFYVLFYGRTYSSYYSNATILIPKEQTNENWEQVTLSASSNVASAQKNLYIDGNNSTSGGTNYWYYRWIVGLPSGSHSSYTNYSSYNYCPNTTSSTFTSVASEQRQVNFTYDNTSDKNLQFRLVDESGNTISTSSTVYYNMVFYNSCSVSSSSSNLTFPRSQSVKVGGRFYFTNSSNRHYIYGYTPNIQMSTYYYSDNYNTYFDIPYTKLNTEAVTITYTTYDPNDTEVPAFNTDITYPYNGGTISSTTLTSYEVPYTYSYTVKQTSGLFYASNQSFTASQASRTISFTLYPNNREFSTVADLEAYQYVWEGMYAYVDGISYIYLNGEWSVNQGTIWLDPPSTNNAGAEFIIGHYWGEGYKMVFNTYLSGTYSSDVGSFWRWEQHTPIEFNFYANGLYYDMHNPTSTSAPNVITSDYSYRIMKNGTLGNYENGQILNIILTYGTVRVELESTGAAIATGSTSVSSQSWYNGLYQVKIGNYNASNRSHLSRIQIYNANNELVNDLKFVKNAGVTGSQEISLYDSVLNVKYDNINSNTPTYHIVY